MNEQPRRTTFFGGCPHDCPDTCAMIYEVEDGRLVEVRGNKEHPMTRGGLCLWLSNACRMVIPSGSDARCRVMSR